MWDKHVFTWLNKAININDQGMKRMLNLIMSIESEVFKYLLKEYCN